MKKIVVYVSIATAALVIGVGGGVLIKRYATPAQKDYSGFDPENYKVDGDALIKKVESYGTFDAAFSKVGCLDSVLYSIEKYKRYDNSYSFCKGVASTIVSQEIRSCQIRNGTEFFEEQVSKSSMVGVANRSIQHGSGGNIDLYSANGAKNVVIDSGVSNYSKNPKNLSAADYSKEWGRTPTDMFNYIICKETVNNSFFIKNEDRSYTITLEMNQDLSTYNYQIQMKTISGLDYNPIFSSVTLTFTLSEFLQLKKLNVNESYNVSMSNIPASINANLEIKYFGNTYYKIPSLEENFDYLEKGVN